MRERKKQRAEAEPSRETRKRIDCAPRPIGARVRWAADIAMLKRFEVGHAPILRRLSRSFLTKSRRWASDPARAAPRYPTVLSRVQAPEDSPSLRRERRQPWRCRCMARGQAGELGTVNAGIAATTKPHGFLLVRREVSAPAVLGIRWLNPWTTIEIRVDARCPGADIKASHCRTSSVSYRRRGEVFGTSGFTDASSGTSPKACRGDWAWVRNDPRRLDLIELGTERRLCLHQL